MDVSNKIEKFFAQYKNIAYKKESTIIQPEDSILVINYLKKGLVKQYIETKDGGEIIINIFRPGSFFPVIIPIAQVENDCYFETIGQVEIFRAPTEDVLKFLKSDPEVLFDLTKRFAQGLNGLTKRIEELTSGGAPEKITSLLTYLASRYGEKIDHGTIITLPVTHQDIASWTGLTRETVSRHIEKLAKTGKLSYRKHFVTVITEK